MAEEIRKGKEEDHIITHASDSTTKKRVGQFIGQVIVFVIRITSLYLILFRVYT